MNFVDHRSLDGEDSLHHHSRRRSLSRFIRTDDGATSVEYAIQLAGVALFLTLAANTLGLKLSGTFSQTSKALEKSLSTPGSKTTTSKINQ